jgi:preprotein translocase subunit SecG
LIEIILTGLFVLCCFVLILFVLLQPGKSDAAAVFGGGANSTAFGPRGTQSVMARITVGAAIIFFLIAFLFSIPGLIGKKPLGKTVGAPQAQPALPAPAPVTSPVPTDLNAAPATSGSPTTGADNSAPGASKGAPATAAESKAAPAKSPDKK